VQSDLQIPTKKILLVPRIVDFTGAYVPSRP
jgi:hypothetical protein